ncbi:MAG: T9SS type A sorting domain-containing protein [Bacteroidetes bacterium]|nr:T9SS type A sorting domain-containing protein [Bacteroidota bacterium]
MYNFYKNNIVDNRKLKFLLKFILFTIYFIFLFQIKTSRSSHLEGGEMTYTSVDSIRYVFTLTYYSNCSNLNLPDTNIITITNECGWSTYTPSIYLISSPTQLSVTCATDSSACDFGPYIGMQKYVYQSDTVNLWNRCTKWIISAITGERLNFINTLTPALSYNIGIYCMINNSTGAGNNSPTFISHPSLFYCVNQPLIIQSGVKDIDGDVIIYSLMQPRSGINMNDTLSYISGYSYTQPLNCIAPMVFDSLTGNLYGTPISNDLSIYAVLVSEYRNGLLIGQIERDATLLVDNCNNIYPDLTGFNGLPSEELTIQANQQNYFQIYSTDPNSADQTIIEYDSSIAGMSFFFSRGQRDTAFFSWMPSFADTAQNPHCFTLKVKDDNCPYIGVSAKRFCLNVSTIVSVDNTAENEFEIFPNPVSDRLKISNHKLSDLVVEIYDIEGRKIMVKNLPANESEIDLSQLENGLYLISIRSKDSDRMYRKKIIKSN